MSAAVAGVSPLPLPGCRSCTANTKPALISSQFAGIWYALAKKDPEGLFLQDNIIAEFSVDENGQMSATAKGRVRLLKSVASARQSSLRSRVPRAERQTLIAEGREHLGWDGGRKPFARPDSGSLWLLQQLGRVRRHGGHLHRHRAPCQVQDEILGCSVLSPERK